MDLQKLKAIDGKDTTYNDVKTPGLRVRISPRTGRKVFAYEYRPPGAKNATKRLLEGIETLKEARARVHELKAEINKGADPLAPPPPKITIRYIADQYRTIKKPSAEDWRCLETRILPAFGEHCALSLKTHQVSAWHSKITKVVKSKTADGQIKKEEVPAPHTADRALDIFKAMMNWAERQELKPRHTNPCTYVDRNFSQYDTEREYEWEDDELVRFAEVLNRYEQLAMQAHSDARYMVALRRADGTVKEHLPGAWSVLAIRFLLVTGVRKREALELKWDQIKEDRQVIEWVRNSRRKETKAIGGGQRVMVRMITEPLNVILQKLRSIRVVGNPYVFVGEDRRGHLKEITRVWYRIRDEAKLAKPNGDRPRLHDLRHFYGQMSAEAGLHEKQIMALIGHSTTRMSARYSKYGRDARSLMAETVATRIVQKLPG